MSEHDVKDYEIDNKKCLNHFTSYNKQSMRRAQSRPWPAAHSRFDASVGVHSQSLGHRHGSAGPPQVSPIGQLQNTANVVAFFKHTPTRTPVSPQIIFITICLSQRIPFHSKVYNGDELSID